MGGILYVVVPCYNEEEVINETAKRLSEKLNTLIKSGKISKMSRVIFVNDGSKDSTWEMIVTLHKSNSLFGGVNLSTNRGHQNALLAGLMTVKDEADVTISMDADLQDDINAIDEMLEKYMAGADIVYGVRSKRQRDSFFKKVTAQSFYKFMNILGAKTIYNHADYRLMSKRALIALEGYREVNLFLRGIVPLIGLKTDTVQYERSERFAGESKYPLKKMLAFASEGITSFSVKPIRMITSLGLFITFVSFIMFIYIFIRHLTEQTVQGWSSMIISIWFLGGLLLLSVGVIGEYIGKIYLEVKQRPRYFVSEYLNEKESKKDEEK